MEQYSIVARATGQKCDGAAVPTWRHPCLPSEGRTRQVEAHGDVIRSIAADLSPAAPMLSEVAEARGVRAPGLRSLPCPHPQCQRLAGAQDARRGGVARADHVPGRTCRISGDNARGSSQLHPSFVTTSSEFRQVFCPAIGYIMEQSTMDRVHGSARLCPRTIRDVDTRISAPLPGGLFGAPDCRPVRAPGAVALLWKRVHQPEEEHGMQS